MIVIDIVVPQCIVLVYRKVEDLQFTIEEETITKDELEVKMIHLCRDHSLLLLRLPSSLTTAFPVTLAANSE